MGKLGIPSQTQSLLGSVARYRLAAVILRSDPDGTPFPLPRGIWSENFYRAGRLLLTFFGNRWVHGATDPDPLAAPRHPASLVYPRWKWNSFRWAG